MFPIEDANMDLFNISAHLSRFQLIRETQKSSHTFHFETLDIRSTTLNEMKSHYFLVQYIIYIELSIYI
jgi:hypothetical protein